MIKEKVKNYFHNLFDIRGDMMSYEEINLMMEENTIIRGSNMWILMLAILIASIGLNVNSTAVIIGAMLISPLMSGILTMGYALAIRDLSMLRKAFGRFGTQVAISLIASSIYFWITPLDVPTSEMIARTNPTLWDVLIALFGGIAGIIGNTRQKRGNVIPGVAIATALMPPLCTAGYGIATHQLHFFLGAFYLFSINTLFIALSAALVTRLLRVPPRTILSAKQQKKINRTIAIITIVTVIPSVYVGAYTVYSTVIDQKIDSYLENEFVFADTQVVQSSIDKREKTIRVSLVGMPIENTQIEDLQKELASYSLADYSLHITQNQTLQGEEDSDKVTIAVQENTIRELQAQLDEKQAALDSLTESNAQKIDCKKLAKDTVSIFTDLSDCRCGIMEGEGETSLLLTAKALSYPDSDTIQLIENWLKTETGYEQVIVQISTEETPDDSVQASSDERSE